MRKGANSRRGESLGMDVKGSLVNRSSAATVPSYRPSTGGAIPAGRREKLALVIPAWREAANLGALLKRVRRTLERLDVAWEVVVVDDDSRDGTEEIVGAMACEDSRVRLLVRRGERGLSGAILHGWRHSDANLLGVMDGDGQHPAEILPELLGAVGGGRDVAIGSRYANGGRCGWDPVRQAMSMAAIMAARPLQASSLRVRDPMSGFFMVRRECIEHVDFQTAGFKLLLEILVCGRIGSVEEIPIVFGRREAGRSKASARVAWDYVTLLARLYRARFAVARVSEAASGD